MTKLRAYQVDAFTCQPYLGNPAGVVANAEGLSAIQMQRIARELNNSETAFILPADGADHDMIVRFFTPTAEVPSCGHATIAANFVRALESGDANQTLVQKTGAGLMPIAIEAREHGSRISMTQAAPELDAPLATGICERIWAALGQPNGARHDLPVQVVSTGHSKVMLPYKSREFVDALSPDLPALAALSAEIGCNGFFPFAIGEAGDRNLVYGRMFGPAIGIAEDPVTGNANGPVGVYLVHHGFASSGDDPFCFTGLQGVAMGRPGHVDVKVTRSGQVPLSVTISGTAVLVFVTEIQAPQH
jgi:PhzF family phenazine biosynthesis protein